MSLIQGIRKAFGWLWKNKARFLLTLLAALVCAVLIFPLDDLSELVTSQVAAGTGNQVFLQFDRMSLGWSPAPGLQFQNVSLETMATPAINARELSIVPSLRALITKKIYGQVTAKGLFRGDLKISLSGGNTTEKGTAMTKVELQGEKLSLQDIRQVARLPLPLKGQLDFSTNGNADFAFVEQPEMDMTLTVNKFELPPSNVATEMGPLSLPELKISNLELKGKLSGGRFLIENGKIGAPGDDLQGSVKGSLTMNLRNFGGTPVPEFGAYTFDIDLQASSGFKTRASFFMSLLAPYQEGDRFRIKVSGLNFMAPPSMTKMR